MSDGMADQHEAAQILGISEGRLRYLAEVGLLPSPSRMLGHLPYWTHKKLRAGTKLWRRGEIYFFECQGFIKIGFTLSAKARLKGIQSSNAHEVALLHSMKGTLAREGEILDAFKEFRARGEWFSDAPELRRYIEKLKARGDRIHESIRERA